MVLITHLQKILKTMLFVISMVVLSVHAQDDATSNPQADSQVSKIQSLIAKMDNIEKHNSFTGRFVHKQGDVEQTLEVSRLCNKDGHVERIVAVDGKPSEIVRFENKVWYYDPEKGEAMESGMANEHSGMVGLKLSQKVQKNYDVLKDYYDFIVGQQEEIAGHKATQLKIISKDKWRFGYHLWMDEQTGLILRTDMYDENWELLETYVFEEINIGVDIPAEKLAPSLSLKKMVKHKMGNAPKEAAVKASKWQFNELPPGYMVKQRLVHAPNGDSATVDQFLVGDGLAMLSVMISPSDVQSDKSTSMQWGTMNVFSRYHKGNKITALGEAPLQTLQAITQNITIK